MRQPHRPEHRRLFDEVFADPVRAASATRYTLSLAGEPHEASALRDFSSSDGAARAVEGTVTAPIDERAEGHRVRVDVFVEDVRYLSYWGHLLTWSNAGAGGGEHAFGGATSGYWQNGDDCVRFNATTEYPGWPPGRAALDMLRRLPYERISVAPVEYPRLRRTGENAFLATAAIGEGLGAIEESTGMRFRDNGLDWGVGHVRPTLAAPSRAAATWELGVHLSSLELTRRNAGRYRDVAVVRSMADGSYEDMVKPRPSVRYRRGVKPPPPGTTYYEEVTDEAEESQTYWSAQSRAFTLVQLLGNGEYDAAATTVFLDPRIEDFDVLEVRERDHDTGVLRRYRMLVESHDRDYVAGTATYRGTAALIEERARPERADAPAARRSSGIVPAGA